MTWRLGTDRSTPRLRIVDDTGPAPAPIGRRPWRWADLRGQVFRAAGRAWTIDGLTVKPNDDGVPCLVVDLNPHDLPGVEPARGRMAVRYPATDPTYTGDYGDLWDLDIPRSETNRRNHDWDILDPNSHNPVCPTCKRLAPCADQVKADWLAHENRAAEHARRESCRRCGRDLGYGMRIVFPAGPDNSRDEPAGPVLVAPGFKPTPPPGDPGDPVKFCGRVGPCRNAAYLYAAEHGWVLPPKDQPRGHYGRLWHIVATRPPQPDTGTDTGPAPEIPGQQSLIGGHE